MIVNELAGSGGDASPWFFHRQKIGPIVGTRTWGGLVGISAAFLCTMAATSQLRSLPSGPRTMGANGLSKTTAWIPTLSCRSGRT